MKNPTPLQPAKILLLFLLAALLLSACGSDLWGTSDPYLTPSPLATRTGPGSTATVTAATPTPPFATLVLLPSLTASPLAFFPTLTLTGTATPANYTAPQGSTISYVSQSGDSLDVVAIHFGVQPSDISSPSPLPATGFINPGTLLFMPNALAQTITTPSQPILPDSELVDSPSAVGFDINAYVNSAGGALSTFKDFHPPSGSQAIISGAEAVRLISIGSSISPRLLLALIQYYTGWVQGTPRPNLDEVHLFGYTNTNYNPATPTLYQPLRPVIQDLLTGYYGWRAGKLSTLTFPDGTTMRIAPGLNAGSVALQYFFSRHLNYADWLQAIDPNTGFLSLFKSMFGDPWERASELGPLFPANLTQPTFILPFEVGALWAFTGGPHPAWEAETAFGALDFAPASAVSGCALSNAWVVAVASGQIVRSENSYVVLDLDGDGFEQTGWVVLYQHIGARDRVPVGTWVNAGARLGHPSCEGGEATGTNVHMARKYNGEWVAAGGPIPFVLSGWTAHAGSAPYQGTLTKGDLTITANQTGINTSQIIRQPGE
ncbi:MAG: hypothetical protein WCE68_17705 [Anaerolineales bacterium]